MWYYSLNLACLDQNPMLSMKTSSDRVNKYLLWFYWMQEHIMAWTCKTWSVHQLALSPALVQNYKQRDYSVVKPVTHSGRCHARQQNTWQNPQFPFKWQCSFKANSLAVLNSYFALLVPGNAGETKQPCLRCASHCTSSPLLHIKVSTTATLDCLTDAWREDIQFWWPN